MNHPSVRVRRAFVLLAASTLLGGGLGGCTQLQQTLQGFGRGSSASGDAPLAPYVYAGNSDKGGSQDIDVCATNARSILASNGYVDSIEDLRNDEGSAVWISGDRNEMGISAKFQCSNNGVTVLAMSGMDNDKLFAEYSRLADLNW
jgi:hypothetical protein